MNAQTTISSLAGYIIRADNSEELMNFYEMLGLKAKQHRHGGPIHFELGPIDLDYVTEVYKRTDTFSVDAIMIKTTSLASTLAKMAPTTKIVQSSNLLFAYIKDPEGRTLMLFETIPETPLTHETHCLPCGGEIPPLNIGECLNELEVLNAEIVYGKARWSIIDGVLEKTFTFNNFTEAVGFIQKIVPIAEREDHHPDILIKAYKKVTIQLITNAINALSINDFIIASKIESII